MGRAAENLGCLSGSSPSHITRTSVGDVSLQLKLSVALPDCFVAVVLQKSGAAVGLSTDRRVYLALRGAAAHLQAQTKLLRCNRIPTTDQQSCYNSVYTSVKEEKYSRNSTSAGVLGRGRRAAPWGSIPTPSPARAKKKASRSLKASFKAQEPV